MSALYSYKYCDFEPQRKEEDMLAQKKMPDGQKEEISQVEPFLSVENLKYFDFFEKYAPVLYCFYSFVHFNAAISFGYIGFCLPVFQIPSCPFCIYDKFE